MQAAIVAIALQILVSLFLVIWTRSRVRKALDAGSEMERVRRELGALLMELEGTADRNVTILEDRIERMRELLAEADLKIALSAREDARREAEASVRRRPAPSMSAPRSDGSVERPPASARGSVDASLAETDRTDRPGTAPAGTAPAGTAPAGTVPAGTAPEGAAGDGWSTELETRPPVESTIPFIRFAEKPVVIEPSFAEKAMELHRRGFSSDIIAARLGSTMSEVELALAVETGRSRSTEGS